MWPAALAPQVAAVDDGNVKVRWKELTALQTALVALHRTQALDAHVPAELPQQTLVCLHQETFCHTQVHVVTLGGAGRDGQSTSQVYHREDCRDRNGPQPVSLWLIMVVVRSEAVNLLFVSGRALAAGPG